MFKGSSLQIAKYNLFFVVLCGVIASVGLLGRNWAYFFTASMVLALPVLPSVTLVSAWYNRFRFDDEQKAFLKPGRRRIPYERVQSILFADRRDGIDVYVKQSFLHTTTLIEAAQEKDLIREELEKRFPGKIRKIRPRILFAPAVAVLVLFVVLAAAHLMLYIRYPQLKTPVIQINRAVENAQKSLLEREYLEDFSFFLPSGFRYAGDEEGVLYFQNRSTKTRIKAVAKISRPAIEQYRLLFKYGMGVGNHGDLLQLTYGTGSVGLIPLFLRTTGILGLEAPRVYYIAGSDIRGIARQGRFGNEELTHIDLVSSATAQEIQFFITGPVRLPENELRKFVDGITVVGTRIEAVQ